MKNLKVKQIIYMAICCDLGLFSKRLISPFTNIITDSLHIPGGIGTSFSLLFIVIATIQINQVGCATLMCFIQAMIALSLGMTGSMGSLSIFGYMAPGIVLDCLFVLTRNKKISTIEQCVLMNSLAALSAALMANVIVFKLSGLVLVLYGSVALFSGFICGIIAEYLIKRLNSLIHF